MSTFPDKNFVCSPCGPGALICDSPTNAQLCGNLNGAPSYLDEGKCITGTAAQPCQKGTYPDMDRESRRATEVSSLFAC